MKFNFALIKKHPYAVGGVILIGGIAVWYFFLGGNSSGATAVTETPTVDPTVQAQLGASQAEQTAQISYQMAAQIESDQTNLAALSAQLQVQANEDTYNYNLGSQQLADQTQVAIQTLTSQQQITQATLSNQLAEDTLAANLQQNLATINAQLEYNVNALSSQNFQAQLNQQMEINGQNDNVIMNASNNNEKIQTNQAWANVAGMAVMAFL